MHSVWWKAPTDIACVGTSRMPVAHHCCWETMMHFPPALLISPIQMVMLCIPRVGTQILNGLGHHSNFCGCQHSALLLRHRLWSWPCKDLDYLEHSIRTVPGLGQFPASQNSPSCGDEFPRLRGTGIRYSMCHCHQSYALLSPIQTHLYPIPHPGWSGWIWLPWCTMLLLAMCTGQHRPSRHTSYCYAIVNCFRALLLWHNWRSGHECACCQGLGHKSQGLGHFWVLWAQKYPRNLKNKWKIRQCMTVEVVLGHNMQLLYNLPALLMQRKSSGPTIMRALH